MTGASAGCLANAIVRTMRTRGADGWTAQARFWPEWAFPGAHKIFFLVASCLPPFENRGRWGSHRRESAKAGSSTLRLPIIPLTSLFEYAIREFGTDLPGAPGLAVFETWDSTVV